MCLINEGGKISSTWYNKPTDTGLILNYHALAPKRYKRSVISGFVHRIARACSSWKHFHDSLEKAKKVMENNQYPPAFYNPIIHQTLTDIIRKEKGEAESQGMQATTKATAEEAPLVPTTKIFFQYRGKCTEDFARSLHKCKAPCTVIMTLRKLKTVLPSLKPQVEKVLKSGLVYKIECPLCKECYVGQTRRHLKVRFDEHLSPSKAVKKHMMECGSEITVDDVEILKTTSKGEAKNQH